MLGHPAKCLRVCFPSMVPLDIEDDKGGNGESTESCSQSDFWSGEEYAGGCGAQRGGAGDTEGKSRRGSFAPIREMAGPGPGRCQETPGGARGPPEIQEGGMEDSLRGTEEQHP